MRERTLEEQRRLYLMTRSVIARHYRRPLTLEAVARALASSPRQLQRAYERFGECSFKEDLYRRRMAIAARLLIEQPAIPVRDVARLVGYRQAPHFAKAFRRRYGLTPTRFRAAARRRAASGAKSRS
ncbi:MAG: helix-turn-helix transcriptional regulator [Solirubrobacterales bacterium]|nr:helix-turn-helix transcriptional regulator [Solirubrobacterales bacterium]